MKKTFTLLLLTTCLLSCKDLFENKNLKGRSYSNETYFQNINSTLTIEFTTKEEALFKLITPNNIETTSRGKYYYWPNNNEIRINITINDIKNSYKGTITEHKLSLTEESTKEKIILTRD